MTLACNACNPPRHIVEFRTRPGGILYEDPFMSDSKLLLGIVAAMGLLVAGWWFGWFSPITNQFKAIKKYTTYR
jgi:hypothetical protein